MQIESAAGSSPAWDPEAETCTLMYVDADEPNDDSWVIGIHLYEPRRGTNPLLNPHGNQWPHAHVKWVRDIPGDVQLCTTSFDLVGKSLGSEGSGTLSFGRIEEYAYYVDSESDGSGASLCSLRIDAEVGGVRFRENLKIFGAEGCDDPRKGPRHHVEAIAAHYSVGAEGPELVIAGADFEFDLCVWQHYRVVVWPEDEVDLPPRWEFTGAGLGMRLNDESCDPATVREDFQASPYVSGINLETDKRTPSIEFESSEELELGSFYVDVPCRISVDVTHLSNQMYHWMPAKLRFEGKGIEVSGACED